MLLLAVIVAFILRLYLLGQIPPGLYRDEAINGLDALRVLQGKHALFFPANNGREPLYIYLSAVSIAIFGQTTFAIRFASAVIGALTTVPVYLLGKSWFNWRVGIFAAWIWTVTLWPVHLSRIGLRVILLAPLLALVFWLGTSAYRQQKNRLWLLAGIIYGLSFYTYLAARLTPFVLAFLLLFLLLTGRKQRLWPGTAWFLLGTFIALLPALFLFIQQPDLILGRSGQVSILHPDVNHGSVIKTLAQQIWAAGAMFIWRGDTILRHNPAGRPIFDLLMALPFLIGLIWSLRNWRRPAAAALLIWILVMLGPTIFAADAPHFLRAAGILPAVVFLPAIGLEEICIWPRISSKLRPWLVSGLLLGSLLLTARDYAAYAVDPQVTNAFEHAAASLGQTVNEEARSRDVYLDRRLWSNWPSLQYLIPDAQDITIFDPQTDLPPSVAAPAVLYVWPYEPLDYIPQILPAPSLIAVDSSEPVYDELDDSVYQLFVRYQVDALPQDMPGPQAVFEGGLMLHQVDVLELADGSLQVDVYWQSDKQLAEELVVFVHLLEADQLIGQHDGPPAGGYWPANWWRSGQIIRDRHIVTLTEPYDPARHEIAIGLYSAATGQRVPVVDAASGDPLGTSWKFNPQ